MKSYLIPAQNTNAVETGFSLIMTSKKSSSPFNSYNQIYDFSRDYRSDFHSFTKFAY